MLAKKKFVVCIILWVWMTKPFSNIFFDFLHLSNFKSVVFKHCEKKRCYIQAEKKRVIVKPGMSDYHCPPMCFSDLSFNAVVSPLSGFPFCRANWASCFMCQTIMPPPSPQPNSQISTASGSQEQPHDLKLIQNISVESGDRDRYTEAEQIYDLNERLDG